VLDRVLGREPGDRAATPIDSSALRVAGEDILGSFRY
jgi:hypothetical protein